jgi:hypothetical protein
MEYIIFHVRVHVQNDAARRYYNTKRLQSSRDSLHCRIRHSPLVGSVRGIVGSDRPVVGSDSPPKPPLAPKGSRQEKLVGSDKTWAKNCRIRQPTRATTSPQGLPTRKTCRIRQTLGKKLSDPTHALSDPIKTLSDPTKHHRIRQSKEHRCALTSVVSLKDSAAILGCVQS